MRRKDDLDYFIEDLLSALEDIDLFDEYPEGKLRSILIKLLEEHFHSLDGLFEEGLYEVEEELKSETAAMQKMEE